MRVMADLSTAHSRRIQISWGQMSRQEFQYTVSEVKAVSGAKFVGKDKGGPYWHVPLSIGVCRQLRESFGKELVVSKRLGDWARRDISTKNDAADLIQANDASLTRLPQVNPKLAEYLRDYQRACAHFFSLSENGVLIADQPGLGKTLETIAGIYESGLEVGSHLVIAPKSSLETVWDKEIIQFATGDTFVYVGKPKEKAAVIDSFRASDAEIKWLIINPESVRGKLVELDQIDPKTGNYKKKIVSKYPFLYEEKWSTVIIDECHKGAVRNPKTVSAQSFYSLPLRRGGKRIGISGTPMKNKAIDLWGVLHWLEPERFSSKWEFAGRYCEIEDNGFGKVIKGIREDREEELWRELSTIMIRRKKSEVAKELPPKNYIDTWCEMTDTQKKQYESMEKNAEVGLSGGGRITATNVLTEVMRLKQFAIARYAEVEDGKRPFGPTKDSGKLVKLMQLIEERFVLNPIEVQEDERQKVIVFSQFSEVADLVARELADAGGRVSMITGGFDGKILPKNERLKTTRREVQEDFQSDDGWSNIVVMTTTAGGVSITLDKADSVYFMDETWSPADMEQAEDRIHRISRIHQVDVYVLRTIGTVDEMIYHTVSDKKNMADAVLDHYRSLVAQGR